MKNNKIPFDSVLLFALVTPFIMTYGLSPGETPYWLFGIIFLLLVLNFFLKKTRHKVLLTWAIIILTIGSAYFSSIIVRQKTAPVYNVHDIILQLEAATRYLIQGINPYSTDYFGTPLEEWNYGEEVNPALYHFVMPPFYLLSFLPFYFTGARFFSLVDGRLPLAFAFFGILVLLHNVVKKENRALALTLFAFNPATLNYFIEGRSDLQMFFWLLSSLYALHRSRLLISGLFMGLAFATKQSAWPIFPLYAAFIYYRTHRTSKTNRIVEAGKQLILFILTFSILIVPFLLWDYKALLDSTIFYLSGSLKNSYPISGYGFGMVLNQLRIIKNLQAYFPFWIFQLIVGLPVLVILIKKMTTNTGVRMLLLSYGIFLSVFWYFSRYFNNSHVGFLSAIFIAAYFWPKDDIRN